MPLMKMLDRSERFSKKIFKTFFNQTLKKEDAMLLATDFATI